MRTYFQTNPFVFAACSCFDSTCDPGGPASERPDVTLEIRGTMGISCGGFHSHEGIQNGWFGTVPWADFGQKNCPVLNTFGEKKLHGERFVPTGEVGPVFSTVAGFQSRRGFFKNQLWELVPSPRTLEYLQNIASFGGFQHKDRGFLGYRGTRNRSDVGSWFTPAIQLFPRKTKRSEILAWTNPHSISLFQGCVYV